MPIRCRAAWGLAVIMSVAILMAPALWNSFPLLQYDTGGYLAPWFTGRLQINRSVPYGLLLAAGQSPDFWPVVAVQSALTVWVLGIALRVHGLRGPRWLLATVAMLSVFTTLPWLTAILLTDIFSGLGVLALYLLLLRDDRLGRGERAGLLVLVAVSAATHSATLLMLLGLMLAGALVCLVDSARIPSVRLVRSISALIVSVLLVIGANGLATGNVGWAPGGIALSFGRMLEDGIVKRYLDERCPDPTLRLCPYKDDLADKADDFFWGGGAFDTLGRFDGLHDEMRRIAIETTIAHPWLQLKSIVRETSLQIVMVETGAGVVNWIWNTYDTIREHTPAAVPAMLAARQQREGLSFDAINAFQVPLAWLAMALLPLIAAFGLLRRGGVLGETGDLAIAVMLGIAGNAAVFGILATAHNRYGARLVWLAGFVVMVALAQRFLSRHHRETKMAKADAAVMEQLAPTGKLRVAVAIAPSPSAQFAIKDGDNYKGVAVILGTALAEKLGVPVEILPHQASGEIQDSAASGRWDVAFLPVDDERKKFVDFGNAYHLLQSTFLAAPGSRIMSVKDADNAGIGIGGVANTATFRAAKKSTPKATHIEFAKVDAAVVAMNDRKIELIALSRESLGGLIKKIPGSRILDDAFLNSSTAVCVPKGKPAALAYVSEFIEEAKASRLVRKAFDEMGLTASIVAPAGMKP